MNTNLLIFFAIPLAVIIFSIALQRVLKCPILVAGLVFAIGVVVTFIINNLFIFVLTVAYTFISYITALIVFIKCKYLNNEINIPNAINRDISAYDNNSEEFSNNNDNILTRINVIPNYNGRTGCICGRYQRRRRC